MTRHRAGRVGDIWVSFAEEVEVLLGFGAKAIVLERLSTVASTASLSFS